MTTQYGQLSYTSLDAADRKGGWQVKETAGEVTATEAELLVARICTGIDPVERLSRYPTEDQLRAAPRRLAFYRINDTTAGYWHTAPAGPDNTGRPGNVFAHVVLDRDPPETMARHRPIELWRSPQWLTPYGGPAVRAAMLPAAPPRPDGTVTAEDVVEFACDIEPLRLGVLCGLLDAVAAALVGGPAVVLGAETDDSAAHWVGLVSFLMSPGTAHRLNFSTFDRGRDLKNRLPTGFHLIAVPRCDLDEMPPNATVIDETEKLFLGELCGQRHRIGCQEIEVTAWSVMAQVALTDPDYAAQLVADIDEYASGVVDDELPPALPTAVSVLNREWGRDAVLEAQSVVAAGGAAAEMFGRR